MSRKIAGAVTARTSSSLRPLPATAVVHVLDEDPDLAAAIPREQWPLATRLAVAPLHEFDRGPWRFFPQPDPAALGALVLSGLILVRIDVGARAHVELLGEGDVISPWSGFGPDLTVPSSVTARIISPLRIAMLDRRFALGTARWPETHAVLIQRLIARSRRLSLQSAINSLSRIEERLELTLWELAQRWGRVTRNGVTLELPITHSQLAEMVAAQRPSVTTAIARLHSGGRVMRTGRHEWLLSNPPPSRLSPLKRQTGLES